ncbi:AsnC family transcriptional regulator [Couchioplanes caeruleus]|uniref:Lrp/AsnC family transcriptional regulator n=1 Tax=Couchioplanes caeruleus TaxID=56438 RepID=UPI00201C8839|nr:AsnC family transcriptional regulator [Couchioplanes caeruleus]UQU67174.1 AsnC family transcriptional regulator [Couchioplanes caeruleus]
MSPRTGTETVVIDKLDRQILHGLQLSPRVPFARLAAVLGVSEQTVARRYQRMRTQGVVRVFGAADPSRTPGVTSWLVRIGCRPGTAAGLADALARRTDAGWVTIDAGGAQLTCSVRISEDRRGVREDLLHHLPRAANVLSVSAHQVLHRFVGRGEADWVAADGQLDLDQRRDLLSRPDGEPDGGDARLEAADRPLLIALAHDGRASYAALADATGWTQRKVALRLAALTASGALYFDLDAAVTLLGFRTMAHLWFTVAPADLAAVGAQLADHRRLAWAAAVTGPATIVANALCRDAAELYRYLTTEVAAIPQVRSCETVPIHDRVKQAVSLVDGGVLRGPVV